MKLLSPIAINEGNVQTNAPEDEAIQWEAVGRDFAEEFGEVLITANASKVYALDLSANLFAGSIKVQDAGTGNTTVLQLNNVSLIPKSILVSPDDAYLAIALSDGNAYSPTYEMHVYSLATGNRVYRRENTGALNNFYGTPYAMAWSADSSRFAFWANTVANPTEGDRQPRVIIVSDTAWAEVESASTPIDYRPDTYNSVASYYAQMHDLVFDDTGAYVFAFGATQRNYYPSYDLLIKVNASTGADSGRIVGRYDNGIAEYNSYRDEVMVVNGSGINIYMASDLSDAPDKPDFSGLTRYGPSMIKALNGVDILYVRDDGSAERNVAFKLSDYSVLGVLNAGTEIRLRDETSTYYVTETYPADGFRLIDKATFNVVTGTNPTVAQGAIYRYTTRLYEALTSNQDRPDIGAVAAVPTWLDLGPVNPLRMFDGKLDSRTTAPGQLTIQVTPGQLANGLGLFNVSAQSVRVIMDDPTDGVVYDSGDIEMLDNSGVTAWWSFFYGPYIAKSDLALTDLPPYPDATVNVTLSNPGSDAAIGELVIGRAYNLGGTKFGSGVGIIDSSTKERDAFENFEVVERKYSKRAEFDVSIRTGSVSGVQRVLAQHRAKPAVWIGSIELESMIIYGFFKDFQINITRASFSEATITVEGL